MAPLRIIGFVLAALLLLAGPARAEPRVALVIGNSNYGDALGKLPNPANDARLMAKTLKGIGFTVVEAEDADQARMKRAIQDFSAQLATAGDGATGLFFYAGHGLQVGGTNYLIPIHAKIAHESDADIEAIPVDLVMKQMAFAESAVNIVILDACRNNPLSRGFRTVTRGLADPTVRPMGSFIAYSTAPGDVAEDGKGTNSPYTTALAQAITRPGASINDVFQEVRGKVLAATGKKQVPWDSSSLTAPFYFVPGSAAPAAVNAQAIDLAFWNEVKDSKSAEDLQAYLTQFPNGVFAPLAKRRLEQTDPSTTRVLHQDAAVALPAAPSQADAAAFESAFWHSAEDDKAIESYEAYLAKYPKGRFVDQARQEIAALKAAPKAPLPKVVPATAKLYARDQARLRDAPSIDAAIVARLSADQPLEATGRSADDAWWRVSLSDGRSGFVAAAVVGTQPFAVAAAAAPPPPPKPAVAPAPETEATVPAGKEREICFDGTDQTAAVRAVACRRLLAAGVPDETDRYNAQLRLGDAMAALGKSEEAMQAYRAAVEIDPKFYGAYSSIGALHLDAGRYAEARAAYDKAVALAPDDANARYQRGTALADLGEFDAARVDVARAIEMKSDETAYYDQLAAIDLAKGDAAAAVADVERGVAASPDYWGGAAILAYYLVGKFDRTIAMAEAGQKAEPDYPYFAIWKALAQRASGDQAGAIATLDAGRTAFGSADWPAALVDYLGGKISESKLRALAASSDPKTQSERLCEINFYLGEVAYIAGDKAAARKALQAAADSRIYHYLEFVAAKARLAALGG